MVVLHYPIGFLTLTLLLELRALMRPDGAARHAIAFALPLTALTALATAVLGWMRSGAGEFDPGLLYWHRLAGFGVAGFTVLAWLLHLTTSGSAAAPAFRFGYRGLLLAAFASLIAAGHLGGSLTHGSGFLTLNAPPALRNLLARPPAAAAPTKSGTGTSLYAQVVRPAFAKKCYSCHGAEKQKGKFRLDLREALLKGGESGETAVVPGDLSKSRLPYHVLLPRDHDDAMPPKGKEPLTPAEVIAVARWIQAGAQFE